MVEQHQHQRIMAKGKNKVSKDPAADGQAPEALSSSPAVCIVPGFLFLGPATAASDPTFLTDKQITRILSVGQTPPTLLDLQVPHPSTGKKDKVTYERLRLTDSPTSDPGVCVDAASALLNTYRSEGRSVLVHCSAAISRSPTVVAAFLASRAPIPSPSSAHHHQRQIQRLSEPRLRPVAQRGGAEDLWR